jgi:hypothetical protein
MESSEWKLLLVFIRTAEGFHHFQDAKYLKLPVYADEMNPSINLLFISFARPRHRKEF